MNLYNTTVKPGEAFEVIDPVNAPGHALEVMGRMFSRGLSVPPGGFFVDHVDLHPSIDLQLLQSPELKAAFERRDGNRE